MCPSLLLLVVVLLVHCGNLACSAHLLIIEPVYRVLSAAVQNLSARCLAG
jgi:hypothetical protein